jgi:hypothetical protein
MNKNLIFVEERIFRLLLFQSTKVSNLAKEIVPILKIKKQSSFFTLKGLIFSKSKNEERKLIYCLGLN